MGLFTRNFDKPGPGVSPDTPRKKGAARFFEILGRDFSTIWLAGILAMLGGLPFAAGVWFAVETHSLVPLVIAGVLGGMVFYDRTGSRLLFTVLKKCSRWIKIKGRGKKSQKTGKEHTTRGQAENLERK